MVSPVRVRVPPLLFSSHFQGKLSALFVRLRMERDIHHNCHHNGRSFEVVREEIIEAHDGLAVHGGGDVGIRVGSLLDGGVSEHLRDQLQLLPVLKHERGKGVPKIVEPNVRQTSFLQERFVGAAMEVVAAHDGSGRGREDEAEVAPEPSVAKPLLVLPEAMPLQGLDGDREQLKAPAGGGLRLLPYDRPTFVLGDRAAHGQRSGLQVYVLPLERQKLTRTQARSNGQDVERPEAVLRSGPKESSDILCRECLTVCPLLFRELRPTRHVFRHELPIHGLSEGFGEGRVDVAHGSRGVTLLGLGIQEALDVHPREVLKPYAPDRRLEVEPNIALVVLIGRIPDRPFHGVLKPKVEIRTHGELLRIEVQPLLEVLKERVTLLEDVLLSLRAEALLHGEAQGCAPLPATIDSLAQGALSRNTLLATSLLRHAQECATGRDHALPTQEPVVQFPTVKKRPTACEVVSRNVLLSDGFLESVLRPAEVGRRFFRTHPLLRSHLLEPLGGAGKAVCGPRERRRDSGQGLRLDSFEDGPRFFKVARDLPEAPNLPIARLPQQVLLAAFLPALSASIPTISLHGLAAQLYPMIIYTRSVRACLNGGRL